MDYLVQIASWDWEFSFGLAASAYIDGPYADHRQLRIQGQLLLPTNLSANSVELTLMPHICVAKDRKRENPPTAVASLQLYNSRLLGLISMPNDALSPVLQMLIAGRFRFVSLHGPRLRYRRALVHSYRLHATLEEIAEVVELGAE
jgi:hypothetical protein